MRDFGISGSFFGISGSLHTKIICKFIIKYAYLTKNIDVRGLERVGFGKRM